MHVRSLHEAKINQSAISNLISDSYQAAVSSPSLGVTFLAAGSSLTQERATRPPLCFFSYVPALCRSIHVSVGGQQEWTWQGDSASTYRYTSTLQT